MIIDSKKSNISFQTRYVFIANNKLIRTNPNAIKVAFPGMIIGSREVARKGQSIYTIGISSCTSYGLIEKMNKIVLGHDNKSAVGITSLIPYYKKDNNAFAVGGKTSCDDAYFNNDIQQFKNKIKTTIFWGQTSGFTNVFYDVDIDTCYLFKHIGEYFNSSISKVVQETVNSIKNLKKAYKIINIAEGDEVYIGNKLIKPEKINQNNKDYKW